MIDRKALTRIAKVVVAEMNTGRISAALPRALEPLEGCPKHVLDLLALLAKEGLKKRPSDELISAYAFILGHSLEMLRYAVEREDAGIANLVNRLRGSLLEAVQQGRISPAILMLILHQFASAKLDVGDALREQLSRLMQQDDEAHAAVGRGEGRDYFAQIAADMENDPFAIHAYLDESMEALPQEMRAGLVMATLGDETPAVREAALGFLLSKPEDARGKLVELLTLAAAHGLVSATMLRRMIAIRNWLPEVDRAALDVAIKTARAKGVACAPADKADVVSVLASGIDGSGAITVLVIVRDGRKHALASLLAKRGFGLRDAWVRRGLSKAELNEILAHVGGEVGLAPSNLDYLAAILCQGLATNLETGNPPPFGALDLVETCGLAEIHPAAMPVESLVVELLTGIDPSCLSASTVASTLRDSSDLQEAHPMLASWFEDNVSKLIGGKRAPRAKQIALLLAGPLQVRRRRWAELCASMALSLKHQGHADWQSFAVLARELLGTRPLDEIGLMTVVAATTLDVLEMQALLGTDWAA
jgi:hypothetical protein